MPLIQLAANHAAVKGYYVDLKQLSTLHATHEGAVRGAFQTLLNKCAKQLDWVLVAEYPIERPRRPPLRVDGALVDQWKLIHGYWEAKDEQDDLPEEVKKKIARGYPTDNILFQSPDRAILYQGGKLVLDESIKEPKSLVEVVKEFFRYEPPAYKQWDLAVGEFKLRVPELAKSLKSKIHEEREINSLFRGKFTTFVETCRQAINPNLSDDAVEEMLIQHMLTERIFRKVMSNPDFARRNAIASDIEAVVDALTARSFNRDKFLSGLERFYGAIERTASTIDSFSEKQSFLNTVYEKFFQGFSVKVADTHGIVYTPQPIVRFMLESVDEILRTRFDRSLGSKDVHILDPFVGTGNFLLHAMRRIPRPRLAYKYEHELHGNEVMLLPYYVASMNIEHEYSEMMGQYKPFEGLCLVDTFELAETPQPSLFTAQNTARVEKQRRSPIFVILGNPPYNAWQTNETDNNKNRLYPDLDKDIRLTYAADSQAKLLNSLRDPYIRAIRWATNRIGDEGVVAFVTNNSFIEAYSHDGVRKHLAKDFDEVYVLDLGGNIRKNPELSGTTHNVFGIIVGVSISFLIRHRKGKQGTASPIVRYAATPRDWRKEEKFKFLDEKVSIANVEWSEIVPNKDNVWIQSGLDDEFLQLVPIGPKSSTKPVLTECIFSMGSNGLLSGRDAVAFNFSKEKLKGNVRGFIEEYSAEVDRYVRAARPRDVDTFLSSSRLKWSRNLKRDFARLREIQFDEAKIHAGSYRPFTRMWLYFADGIVDERGQLPRFFPTQQHENVGICCPGVGNRQAFGCFALRDVPARDYAFEKAVLFPYYYFADDGSPVENITDWALERFRSHYSDPTISKRQVFYYVYAVLHHPSYRARYESNLRRELARIPMAPSFAPFALIGQKLMDLHLDYEKQPEYPLIQRENRDLSYSLRTERLRLSKERATIFYNESLALEGIPAEAYRYKIGNRSAIEWVVDQNVTSIDKLTGIVNDPNRLDDEGYIVRLIGQVVTVSLETVRLIDSMPECESPKKAATSHSAVASKTAVKSGKMPKRRTS